MRALRPAIALALAAALASPGAGEAAHVSGVRIAVIDTGIHASHEEFARGQVVAWRDFVSGRPKPYDDVGHGTAVASRAAGLTLGAAGGVSLVVAKVLDADGRLASWEVLAEAIRWAADRHAAAVNVSMYSTALQPLAMRSIADAIEYATVKGSLVVWIAGNDAETPSTPHVGSSSPQALVVGAYGLDGARAPYSRRDPELLARGEGVLFAWNDGGIAGGSGTSFAAPVAAGVVARMRVAGAPADPAWLKWALLHSATDTGAPYDDEGYGLLDPGAIRRALSVARGDRPVPGPDGRDLSHLATAGARAALSGGKVPAGALPPA